MLLLPKLMRLWFSIFNSQHQAKIGQGCVGGEHKVRQMPKRTKKKIEKKKQITTRRKPKPKAIEIWQRGVEVRKGGCSGEVMSSSGPAAPNNKLSFASLEKQQQWQLFHSQPQRQIPNSQFYTYRNNIHIYTDIYLHIYSIHRTAQIGQLENFKQRDWTRDTPCICNCQSAAAQWAVEISYR